MSPGSCPAAFQRLLQRLDRLRVDVRLAEDLLPRCFGRSHELACRERLALRRDLELHFLGGLDQLLDAHHRVLGRDLDLLGGRRCLQHALRDRLRDRRDLDLTRARRGLQHVLADRPVHRRLFHEARAGLRCGWTPRASRCPASRSGTPLAPRRAHSTGRASRLRAAMPLPRCPDPSPDGPLTSMPASQHLGK